MVTKEAFIGWKKGDVGKLFAEACNADVEGWIAEIVNRKEVNHERDMWIRGAIFAMSEMAAWIPELAPEMEMPDE